MSPPHKRGPNLFKKNIPLLASFGHAKKGFSILKFDWIFSIKKDVFFIPIRFSDKNKICLKKSTKLFFPGGVIFLSETIIPKTFDVQM